MMVNTPGDERLADASNFCGDSVERRKQMTYVLRRG